MTALAPVEPDRSQFQVIQLTGRLTADPELRSTNGGTDVCVLRIANNDREEPLYIDVETYGKQAKPCAEFLRKGRQVAVSGRLDLSSYDGKDGTKRFRTKVIGRVEFLGAKPEHNPDDDIEF